MKTARCPTCNSDIIIEEDAFEGDIADCANCGSLLEISSLHPIQLNVLKDEEEESEEGAK